MDIKINDKFSLSSDERNFILIETKTSQEGKVRKEKAGNYFTINQALSGFVEKSLKQSDVKSFQELRNVLEEIRAIVLEIKNNLEF